MTKNIVTKEDDYINIPSDRIKTVNSAWSGIDKSF